MTLIPNNNNIIICHNNNNICHVCSIFKNYQLKLPVVTQY